MEEPMKVIVPAEGELPMQLREEKESDRTAPEPFRTPHSRDYPVLGYE